MGGCCYCCFDAVGYRVYCLFKIVDIVDLEFAVDAVVYQFCVMGPVYLLSFRVVVSG